MKLDELRLSLRPGDGLAARFPGVVLLVPAYDEEQSHLVRQMLELAREAAMAPAPGRTLPRRLAGLLVGPEGERVPPFCALGLVGDDVGLMVYGDTEVEAIGAVGSFQVSGSEAATWVDRIISGDFRAVSIKAAGQPEAEAGSPFELSAGVVPAAALLLTDAAAVPEASASEAPAASGADSPPGEAVPAPSEPVEPAVVRGASAAPEPPPVVSVPLSAPTAAEAALAAGPLTNVVSLRDGEAERRAPLPVAPPRQAATEVEAAAKTVMVKGVHCKNGHFNHPEALYCAYDGSAIVDITRIEVEGPRPSLGVLVFDDGSAFSLVSDYVVGRRPQEHADLEGGDALPLAIDDPQEQVSRTHALVRLVGWEVQISDLGSRNGTFVQPGGAAEPQRLTPDQPLTIAPGTRVRLGEKSFVYESHHRR